MDEKNNEIVPQYSYTEKEMDKISAYIEQQYGEFETVGHEVVSPDIHCDVVVVPPTEEQPYYVTRCQARCDNLLVLRMNLGM